MRLVKRVLLMIITFLAVFYTCVCAEQLELKEFNLESINVPDDFIVCTRDYYHSDFERIFRSEGLTHAQWVEQNMLPNDIYLYATDKYNNCIYVQCRPFMITDLVDKSEGYIKYINDYNIIKDEEDKRIIVEKFKSILIQSGVVSRDITISWLEKEDKYPTPYYKCLYYSKGSWYYEYHTIYGDNEYVYTLMPQAEPDDEVINMFDKFVEDIEYGFDINYDDVIKELRNKINKNTNNNYDYLKYLRSIFFILLVYSIAFVVTVSLMLYKY